VCTSVAATPGVQGGPTSRLAGARRDDGAALVLALIMISVVAVVLLAVLSYTGSGLRAAGAVRTDRRSFYAADGAVEAAIQNLRNNPDLGYTDKPSCDFSLPRQGAQPAVSVACTARSKEKRSGGTGGVDADQPLHSILTLGRAANQNPDLNTDPFNFWDVTTWPLIGGLVDPAAKGEQGLYYRPMFPTKAGTATLKGDVFSNSNVVVNRGTLKVQPGGPTQAGSVKTRQGCKLISGGKIIPAGCPPVRSPDGGGGYPATDGGYADDGLGSDPRYPSRLDLEGVPAPRSVPACAPGQALVVFEPGWYADAGALSAVTDNCKGPDGKGADFWFKPGLYYFDFRNAGSVACADGSRAHQWCIGNSRSNARILGGTPVGPDGGIFDEAHPDRFRFPQGCDDTRPGVQFVFGGDSGVRIVDGTFNLCAGPPAGSPGQAGYTRQQIAVYGIRPLPPIRASAVDAHGSPAVKDAENARILFENPTSRTAKVQYSAFALGTVEAPPLTLRFPGLATQGQPGGYPAFPPGTVVDKVELRANYSTLGQLTDYIWGASPLFRVKTPQPGGGLLDCGANTTLRTTFNLFDPSKWGKYSQDFADVTDCFRDGPSGPVDLDRLKNFEVDWVARSNCLVLCSVTDELDGVELHITLRPVGSATPTWLPGSGCIVGLPNYANGGGPRPNCALMKWNTGNPSLNFSVDLPLLDLLNREDPAVMTSIIGTVYAPGAVLDFGEYGPYCGKTRTWLWVVKTCVPFVDGFEGLSYPVVDRGLVVRQLTMRGLKIKSGYTGPVISCGPGECGGMLHSPRLVRLEARVGDRTRVTSWVCFGPVEATGPPGPDRLRIGDPGRDTGKYCTGDGTGRPRIVRWNAT